jgi:glycosidase
MNRPFLNSIKVISLIILFSFLFYPLSFSQEIKSFVKHPEWSYNKSIYEVNIRQFTPEGTFKAFSNHLPRLKELGAHILWLMPIHPIGEKNRKGTLGSYYSVKDYLAVNPEFGTIEEFKELVSRIHSMGMYVIIDWVANHTAWDHPWVLSNPEFFNKDSAGNFIPPVDDWSDVIDLNYDNKQLWKEMTNALKFWVEECDIDGYRCDVAGMIPTEFWNQAREVLEKVKPVFMLAEWETPEMHYEAFDASYSWEIYKIMNSVAKDEKTVEDIKQNLKEETSKYPREAFRMRFTSNHDENSWNGTEFERLGEGASTFAALTYFLPGIPLIYSGQEVGLNRRLSFFEKDTISWKEHPNTDLYKVLNDLKSQSKVLLNGERGGEIAFVINNQQQKVLSFARIGGEEKIIAVFNLSSESLEAQLKAKILPGKYTDLFSGEQVILGMKETFELNPWEFRIYIK